VPDKNRCTNTERVSEKVKTRGGKRTEAKGKREVVGKIYAQKAPARGRGGKPGRGGAHRGSGQRCGSAAVETMPPGGG